MVLAGFRLGAEGLQQGRGGGESSHLVHVKAGRVAEDSNWLSLWV